MSIPRYNTFAKGNYLRPSDDIEPNKKQKSKKYSLEYSRFIYSQYIKNSSAITSDMADNFIRNRSYARGEQDTEQYRNWIVGKKDDDHKIPSTIDRTDNNYANIDIDDLGLENINFDDVFSPLPKYIEIIIGIMRSQEHDIIVNAEDENSGTLKEELKFSSYIRSQLKPLIIRFNTVFNIPDTNEEAVLPASLEELELFDNIGAFKLPYEIAMEKLIGHTFSLSHFEGDIKDDVIKDLLVDGYTCVVTSQDPTSGKFKPEHKDTVDIILENSNKYDFSDSTWGGYIEYYTINKLRAETGWTEKQVSELAEKYVGQFGNPKDFDDSLSNGQYGYDDYKIPVLHSFWKTIDTEYYSERQTGTGPKQIYEPWRNNGRKPPKTNRKSRKYDKVNIRRLYHAKWVIGSEKVFDYGIVTNTPYNFGTNDVEFPIRLVRIKGKPKIESMIPIEDQIYLTFVKTQNAIAKAAPPGLAIEWGAIENIQYGNKKLKPKDSITLYTNTGNMVYKLDVSTLPGRQGTNRVGKPIEELRGGLGTAIADGIQGIEFLYRQLDVITGIDGITSVTQQPNRDTGKAVTEMAVAATSNTLKGLYNNYIRIKEQTARVVAWQIQAMLTGYDISEIEECPYFKSLGRSNLSAIMTAGDYPPVVYGFSIEARATELEKERILEAAKVGLQSGKNGIPAITYSEYSFILRFLNSGKSIKYLELWMAKKEQERTQKEQKVAEQNIKIQAEEQRKTKQQDVQFKVMEINAEKERELAVVEAKGQQERLTLQEKYNYDLKLRRIEIFNQKTNTNNN